MIRLRTRRVEGVQVALESGTDIDETDRVGRIAWRAIDESASPMYAIGGLNLAGPTAVLPLEDAPSALRAASAAGTTIDHP